jgi:predicted 2-oxoglutarate/Fe(II)-dependent dioxygenase YbiX
MKFKPGRQNTGYSTLTLFSSKLFKCDAYILKYPTQSYIPEHIDSAPPGYIHNRINIEFPTNHLGGEYIENPPENSKYKGKTKSFGGFKFNRIYPSETKHSVALVTHGTRIVFSFGWLSKRK